MLWFLGWSDFYFFCTYSGPVEDTQDQVDLFKGSASAPLLDIQTPDLSQRQGSSDSVMDNVNPKSISKSPPLTRDGKTAAISRLKFTIILKSICHTKRVLGIVDYLKVDLSLMFVEMSSHFLLCLLNRKWKEISPNAHIQQKHLAQAVHIFCVLNFFC